MDELLCFKDYRQKYRDIAENNVEWVPLFEKQKYIQGNIEHDIFSFCAICKNENSKINSIFKNYEWGFTPDSFGKSKFYKIWSQESDEIVFETGEFENEFEYLVAYRTFDSDYEPQIEINQKLIWYYNLVRVEDGYIEPFSKDYKIKISKNEVLVNLNYLKDFLAATNKVCIIGFDNRRFYKEPKELNKEYKEEKSENYICSLVISKSEYRDFNYYSCILGKVIIKPFSEPLHSDYKYLKPEEKKFEEFIIGIDKESGKEIQFTCNEEELANFFGKNPGAPHFLTPVYFSKDVLIKYTNNPTDYTIFDDHITYINQWSIPYSINNLDKVVVWLGDLGRIPNTEQIYWKSFNIIPSGKVNEKFIRRQLNSEWTDSIREEKKLFEVIDEINELFTKKYSEKLFIDLSEGDSQLESAFIIPTNNSTTVYQNFLMQLCKITIERINTKLISKKIPDKELKDEQGKTYGSRIQLKILLTKLGFIAADKLDEILKKIYNSRNKLAGHKASLQEYNKVWARDKDFKADFISDSKSLINDLVNSLGELIEEVKQIDDCNK